MILIIQSIMGQKLFHKFINTNTLLLFMVNEKIEYTRSAVLIIDKNKILLMHRRRDGKKSYVIPGGQIDNGESIEQTAVREAKEETNLNIVLGDKLFSSVDEFSSCCYFTVKSFSGIPEIVGEEKERNCEANFYELEWVKISELSNILLYPIEAAGIIQKYNLKNN